MVDLPDPHPSGRLLGRPKPSPKDRRDFKLARYVRFDDVKIPGSVKWHEAVLAQGGYPMLLNDRLGCCTCATKRHTIQTCIAAVGGKYVPTDAETLADYEREGYRPGDPSTDQGAIERDVLNHWRADKTHGLHAFASCDADHTEIKVALTLFGGLYIGVNLPLNAQAQTDKGFWQLKSGAGAEPGSWGGHAVNLTGFYRGGVYLVTWGEVIRASWSWLDRYCVAPGTRVLTDDLRYVPVEDVLPGEGLLGFDEHGPMRRWRRTTCESTEIIERPCWRVTFDDGTEVVCSAEHKWLVAGTQAGKWVETRNLRSGAAGSRVAKPLDVWDRRTSRDAGYLAAAFDGEGTLVQSASGRNTTTRLQFCQKDNEMYAEVERALKSEGFVYTDGCSRPDVRLLNVTRRPEVMRFLGSVRPARLLPKFSADRFGMMTGLKRTVRVVKREFLGDRPVVAMSTGTGTFIAEGLASHNCDERWAVILPDFLTAAGETPKLAGALRLDRLDTDLAKIAA